MTDPKRAAAQTIAALTGPPPNRLAAARTVKNAVVGNPTNKRLYITLGVLQPLVAAANDVLVNPDLAEQAVAALGSLACCSPPEAIQFVAPALLRCLFCEQLRPVHAAARALKLVVCSDVVNPHAFSSLIANDDAASRIVSLLTSPDDGMAEVCAVIIARTCLSNSQAVVFERINAVQALVRLLWRTNHERCVEACLNALAALARHSRPVSQALTGPHALVTIVMPLTRSRNHSLRLAACRLLTIFHSANLLPSGLDGVVTNALVNLLTAPDYIAQISTALTLSDLVLTSSDLQCVATDAGAVAKLTYMIFDAADKKSQTKSDMDTEMYDIREHIESNERERNRKSLLASSLTALAALTSDVDSARDAVISYEVLPTIVDSLEDKDVEVVLAAVKCIRSLSRSVKIVRRDMANETIGRILLSLLTSENELVRRCASAALCNLVLEFSPVRSVVLDNGGTDALVDLLSSDDEELRKNSLWALKNLLFKADSETKTVVMTQLGYENLQALCADKQPRVRELAMTVVRNLACSGSTNSQKEQLDALFAATGDRIIGLLSEALKPDTEYSEIAVQALYVVCNIASGTEEHKASLMESNIPQLILQWTSHKDERARIAAVWCAINLSWKDRPAPTRRPSRYLPRTRGGSFTAPRRLDVLRRQHLPLPSTNVARRVLEQSESSDAQGPDNVSRDTERSAASDGNRSQTPVHPESPATEEADDVLVFNGASQLSPRGGEAPKSSGYEWRIERLRELGFEGRLRSLMNDPHIEVQGRARAALELFDCEDVHPLDYDPSALLDYTPPSFLRRQSPGSSPVLLRASGSESSSAGTSG